MAGSEMGMSGLGAPPLGCLPAFGSLALLGSSLGFDAASRNSGLRSQPDGFLTETAHRLCIGAWPAMTGEMRSSRSRQEMDISGRTCTHRGLLLVFFQATGSHATMTGLASREKHFSHLGLTGFPSRGILLRE